MTDVVKICLLKVHLGLPFCPTCLCLAHLDEKCGNVLSSLLCFEKRQIKIPKIWGGRVEEMEKFNTNLTQFTAFSQELKG